MNRSETNMHTTPKSSFKPGDGKRLSTTAPTLAPTKAPGERGTASRRSPQPCAHVNPALTAALQQKQSRDAAAAVSMGALRRKVNAGTRASGPSLCPENRVARPLAFRGPLGVLVPVPHQLALHHENNVFGDVGGEVRDPLQVSRG
jgi:hypothetical protein